MIIGMRGHDFGRMGTPARWLWPSARPGLKPRSSLSPKRFPRPQNSI